MADPCEHSLRGSTCIAITFLYGLSTSIGLFQSEVFFFFFAFAGTWEASDSVSGSGKNSGWKHNSSGSRANPSQFCSYPFHGPSGGSNSAVNINSTQVGWWDPHGHKFQLPPYDRRYPCLHWCIEVWGKQELSAAGCRIPSQAPHWSISDDRASWSCEFGSYPKVLSQLLTLGSFCLHTFSGLNLVYPLTTGYGFRSLLSIPLKSLQV